MQTDEKTGRKERNRFWKTRKLREKLIAKRLSIEDKFVKSETGETEHIYILGALEILGGIIGTIYSRNDLIRSNNPHGIIPA